jgi:hypothetical protein
VKSPFRLGAWGPIVNALALLYGGAMLVNFAWPRASSNPTPDQTAGALSLGVGLLNRIPILYSVFALVVIIGALYYLAVEHRRPLDVEVPPEVGPVAVPAESLAPDEIA